MGKEKKNPTLASRMWALLFLVIIGLVAYVASQNVPKPSPAVSPTRVVVIASTVIPPTIAVAEVATGVPTEIIAEVTEVAVDPESYFTLMVEAFGQVDVVSARVSDTRATGGKRILMIAYITNGTDGQTMAEDLGRVLGTFIGGLDQTGFEFDEISLIYGPNQAIITAIVTVQTSDILAYAREEITLEEFYSRFEITPF